MTKFCRTAPLIVLLLAAALSPLSATTLEEIISRAMEESPSYGATLQSLEQTRLTILSTENVTGASFSAGLSSGSWTRNPDDGSSTLSGTPTFSWTSPDEGYTKISVSMPSSGTFTSGENGYSLTPTLTASHTFDLRPVEDMTTDLAVAKYRLQYAQSAENSRLSFENSVIDSISSILSARLSVRSAERKLEKAERSLANDLALGEVSTGTLVYTNREAQIEVYRSDLENAERTLALLESSFETLTGFPFEEVEDIPEPDLAFTPLEGGNSKVLIAQLEYESAMNEYELLSKNKGQAVVLSGTGLAGFSRTENSTDLQRSYSISGGADFSMDSVSLSAGTTLNWADGAFTPTINFSGTWSNSGRGEAERIAIESARAEAISKEIAVHQALLTYNSDAASIAAEILSWQLSSSQTKNEADYNERYLAQAEDLYERGYINQETLTDARNAAEDGALNLAVKKLDGLQLERRIAILNL